MSWKNLVIRVFLLAVVLAWAGELWAAPVTVTVTITRVVEINCDEGFGEACPNDYYPKMDIDAQGLDDGKSRFCCAHGTDFQPNWVFTRTVDTSHVPFNLHIELWDQDDLSADDLLDISPDGSRVLDLKVNMNSCTWSGNGLKGFLNTQSTASGSGKDSAKIYFTITTSSPACVDSDGDGLLDGWETGGFDADANGSIDVNLPLLGANPKRADLFLELDYLVAVTHDHKPQQAAIQQVVQAFANAPVPNPDGTSGIQLHVDVGPLFGAGVVTKVVGTGGVTGNFGDLGGGNQIAEVANTVIDYSGSGGATNFFTLKNANFNSIRDAIFRYGIFGHQTNVRAAVNDCTSGNAKGIPGVNFYVTLGGTGSGAGNPACWGTDAAGFSVGTQLQQAGTLMHEFGHTLGLQHGGGDGLNNKPNYLSVMNYSTQACTVPVVLAFGLPGGCDYSRILLPTLNENSLDECQGADSGALGLGAVDFSGDKILQGVTNCQPPNNTNVVANVNGDTSSDANGNGTQDPGEPPVLGTLTGFQDWGAISYNFRTIFDFTTAGKPSEQEADPRAIESARAYRAAMSGPKLKFEKTGPANAVPGDTLTYTIKVENKTENSSRGPALNVVVTDTKPDASTQVFKLGTIALGATKQETATYPVACSVLDGTVLKNTAQLQGSDLLSNPVTAASTVQTVIHRPVLTLSKTATATVNAGEAITYTLTYSNTGSGAASNVVVTDILPTDVYYSQALDQGSGPKPSTVTLNGDGTRTLVWNVGTVAGSSGPKTIGFTARPTLLALGDTVFENKASLSFQNGTGCTFETLKASARTVITVVPLQKKREPHGKWYWREHAPKENAEILARIQATDQRYDGRDGTAADGALVQPEVKVALALGSVWNFLFHHNSPKMLDRELLALYFNLATRRVNAGTELRKTRGLPGMKLVRDAALFGRDTLLVPYSEATEKKYRDANEVIEEIY